MCVLVSSFNTNVFHANLELKAEALYRVLSCIKTSFVVRNTMMPVGVKGLCMIFTPCTMRLIIPRHQLHKKWKTKKFQSPVCVQKLSKIQHHINSVIFKINYYILIANEFKKIVRINVKFCDLWVCTCSPF